jgi:hypothetical protein
MVQGSQLLEVTPVETMISQYTATCYLSNQYISYVQRPYSKNSTVRT